MNRLPQIESKINVLERLIDIQAMIFKLKQVISTEVLFISASMMRIISPVAQFLKGIQEVRAL